MMLKLLSFDALARAERRAEFEKRAAELLNKAFEEETGKDAHTPHP